MKKQKKEYKCSNCGYIAPVYYGRCPECRSFNTIEEVASVTSSSAVKNKIAQAEKLDQVDFSKEERISSGIEEFDRVMGFGIVRDGVSIVTAKPGAGKSTLLLQVAHALSKKGLKILYASGEESLSQIKSRSLRIGKDSGENIWLYSHNIVEDIVDEGRRIDADIVIVDSIQTIKSRELTSRPGTPTQTMECASILTEFGKNPERKRAVFMVGQMTKEDELAGVRALEHLVDTVLLIETEDNEELRILVSTKNRYGSTGETGFFLMTEEGLMSLDNPSMYFMTKRSKEEYVPGSAITVTLEGTRPVLLEVEALASKSFLPYPSRIADCIKRERLNTLISILEERGGIKLYDRNMVVKTMGDMKLKEPSSNLAVLVSMASSTLNKPVDGEYVFIGDVGLTGELKQVPSIEKRLKEAHRMGFKKAFIPLSSQVKDVGIEVEKVRTLSELLNRLF